MAISKRHRVLVATDGSPSAQAALSVAVRFPWSASAGARAVVGRSEWLRPDSEETRAALALNYKQISDAARRALSARWRKAAVAVSGAPPIEAILEEARRYEATAIVLGWRGQGTFRRLLAGSVSRTVAAHAECPVLVVREAPRALRRFVIGYDGCPNAQRALELLCSLEPSGNSAVLVDVTEPMRVPASLALLPAASRAHVRRQLAALNAERSREARDIVNAGVSRLKRCGWPARGETRTGAPLEGLLEAAQEHRADVLVLGACAVSGLERALLGSVANGALNRSRIPVLLAR